MPGYKVLTAKQGKVLNLGLGSQDISVQCQIGKFHFSAHSHRGNLLRIVEQLKPRQVILVHGEPGASGWMRETIKQHFPNTDIHIGKKGVEIEY